MSQRSTVRKLQVFICAAAFLALTETWSPLFTQLLGSHAASPPSPLRSEVSPRPAHLSLAKQLPTPSQTGSSFAVRAAFAAAALATAAACGVKSKRAQRSPIARQACLSAGVEATVASSAMSAEFSFAGCAKAEPKPASKPSRVTRNMLMPKTIRFKKPHKPVVRPFQHSTKWHFRGNCEHGAYPYFGKYALQSLEEAWISSKQIENVRRAIVRTMERKGKLWIRVFPHNAITKRVAESRMGAGKGALEYWVAAIRPNFILFEVDGVGEDIARNAFRKASYRLPCRVKFITKDDGPSRFESGFAGKPMRSDRDERAQYEGSPS